MPKLSPNAVDPQTADSFAVLSDPPERPTALAVNVDGIPAELRELPQWVGWGYEQRGDKWTKPPLQPSGQKAQSTNPRTWNPLGTVLTALHKSPNRFDGVGFVFRAEGPYVGIDLDHSFDDDGKLLPWAAEVVAAFPTYCEYSVSRNGLHLICKGTLPPEFLRGKGTGRRKGPIEVYHSGRFFCTSGVLWPGSPREIVDCTPQLAELLGKITAPVDKPKPTSTPAPVPAHETNGDGPSDQQILDKARASKSGAKFSRLWSGDASGYGSHSDADLALVSILSFWTGPDESRIDQLFRQSGLVREKWTAREDYRRETIAKALGGNREYYQWNGRARRKARTARPPDDESEMSAFDADKPRIQATDENLPKHAAATWQAIRAVNDPPSLFRFGGRPSRIGIGDEGEPVIALLDLDGMRHVVARVADWFKFKRVGEDTREVSAYPPSVAVRDVLATPEPPLPILTRIVEAPVFARDGTLQTQPGYHPASRTYFAPAAGFSVPDVPLRPTVDDIARAVGLITVELTSDFPFTADAERAHAVALLLQPFCRDLIDGPTPLHLFEKPTPGTGATLLVDMLTYPATGRTLAAMTEGRMEDEWRKRLTAKLMEGPAFLFLDNLRARLDSAALSAAITASIWEDRILGVSKNVRIAVRCAWLATGNNPALSNEMSRRTIRVRLDAKVDEPWLRSGFRHDDLRGWAKQNRGSLAWAALVLIRAWLAEGRPKYAGQKLGMFESWSETIGGILTVAGIPGFLGNLADFYREADDETTGWRQFIAQWWERHGTAEVTSKQLWELTADTDPPCHVGDGTDQSKRSKFGRAIGRMRDRVFSVSVASEADTYGKQEQTTQRFRLDRTGSKQSVTTWKLTPLDQ